MDLSQRTETTLVSVTLKILRRVSRGSFAFVSLIHTCLDILQHFDTNAYYQRLLTAAAWRGLEPALGSRSEGPTFIIHVAFNTVMFRSCRPPNDNSAPAAHFQQNLLTLMICVLHVPTFGTQVYYGRPRITLNTVLCSFHDLRLKITKLF
jgi:hypothetical protein